MIAKEACLIQVGTLRSEASVRITLDLGEIPSTMMGELYDMRKNVVVGLILSNETDLNDFLEWKKLQPPKQHEALITMPELSSESSTSPQDSDGPSPSTNEKQEKSKESSLEQNST